MGFRRRAPRAATFPASPRPGTGRSNTQWAVATRGPLHLSRGPTKGTPRLGSGAGRGRQGYRTLRKEGNRPPGSKSGGGSKWPGSNNNRPLTYESTSLRGDYPFGSARSGAGALGGVRGRDPGHTLPLPGTPSPLGSPVSPAPREQRSARAPRPVRGGGRSPRGCPAPGLPCRRRSSQLRSLESTASPLESLL